MEIQWLDSYGCTSGWSMIEQERKALTCKSIGYLVSETEDSISLANSIAEETEFTAEQANGIMTIPKCAIINQKTYG